MLLHVFISNTDCVNAGKNDQVYVICCVVSSCVVWSFSTFHTSNIVFSYGSKAKQQTKLFQFLLLDNNFPTTNITLAKSTLHQTLPQSPQNPISIINYHFRKHSKVNKGVNLANCVRIKMDGLQEDPSKEFFRILY